MPYGIMHDETKKYILDRASRDNITPKKLHLEPDEGANPTRLVEVSIVIDGTLDEEFTIGSLYAVNVADYLGEHLNEIKSKHDIADWSVEVYAALRTDGDSPIYRITDES